MKYAIPEISWHNRDPVLSVDFQPKCAAGDPVRLATGGTDTHVLIWYISRSDTGSVDLEVAADLTRHQKAVNVVRWSPSGEFLASGDDESIIFIWKQKMEEAPPAEGEEQYKELWVIHKTLRGHVEDVLDISWSLDSLHLASGSVDNKLLLWDVGRGRHSHIASDHKGFVQGVAWDPLSQYVVTASSDRVFRTFDIATKKVIARSSKAVLPFPSDHALHNTMVRLYHDDTLQTYYRRLSFSPDGLLIAVPAGRIEPEQGKLDMKPINAVYIYTRYSLKVPACVLPCGDAALVCRWSPCRYAGRPTPTPPAFPLRAGARCVLAVGTRRSVLLYDTHQRTPIAIVSNIHYTRLTDLTWSADGRTLVASSTDGFCSVITFGYNELGEPLPDKPVEVAENDAAAEPMETDELQTELPKDKPEAQTANTQKQSAQKIESFMKFKTPSGKSPKKQKVDNAKQKTPVKLDVLVETAMPSWSDNSNSELTKSLNTEEAKPIEIMEIEDSEDIKLVYEDTCKGDSPTGDKDSERSEISGDQDKSSKESPEEKVPVVKKSPEKVTSDKKSPEKVSSDKKSPMQVSSDKKSPVQVSSDKKSPVQVSSPSKGFFQRAKVRDSQQPALSASSPKAPRRVSFVTLSSPKNKKK